MPKQLNIAEIKLDMNQPRMLTVQLADELRRLIASLRGRLDLHCSAGNVHDVCRYRRRSAADRVLRIDSDRYHVVEKSGSFQYQKEAEYPMDDVCILFALSFVCDVRLFSLV